MRGSSDVSNAARNGSRAVLVERLSYAAFLAGGAFLCVLLGILMGVAKWAPYYWTKDALTGLKAVSGQREMLGGQYPPHLWEAARYPIKGVVDHDPKESQPGCTLYTTGAESAAMLIDSSGRVLHRWEASFRDVWPKYGFAKSLVPDSHIFMRRGHVFPNGDLLAIYETPVLSPNGMGLARIDRNSQVIWSYDGNCHHDFAIGSHDQIYVLTHELRKATHSASRYQDVVNIEDFITILSADGKRLRQFSLLNALYDSPYYRPDILPRDSSGDLLHANTVNIVGEEFAAHYPWLKAGQLMVCFRNTNMVVVVDPESQEIVWATSGPWHFPHDPDPLPNGNIMMFDNCYNKGREVRSRVLEFDCGQDEIVWQYSGNSAYPLRSDIRSTQQLLDNNNVLICESNGGRILEVTRDGEIVWQFFNPTRGGDKEQHVPVVTGVRRYRYDHLPFLSPDTSVTQASVTDSSIN